MKKLTQEEFVQKAREIHGDRYDYSQAVYVTRRAGITIICPTCGEFQQKATYHLTGRGCPICKVSRRASSQVEAKASSFEDRARAVHGDTYGYSRAVYTGKNNLLTITCSTHGDFPQTPAAHLAGRGCWKCAKELKRHSPEKFVSLARVVHGDRYEYDTSSFTSMHNLVQIHCLDHGWYSQMASDHVYRKAGCGACADQLSSDTQSLPFQEFERRASLRHRGKYSYSSSGYVTYSNKIEITCPDHGVFMQTGGNHEHNGHGCPKCANTGGPSLGQREIAEYIQSLGFEVKLDFRLPESLLEVDCFVPSKSFAVEYDGAWWHSERTRPMEYHAEKLRKANDAGIRLIQIFDDQWKSRKPAWKQLLAYQLGVNVNTVQARKCQVVPLAYPQCSDFYDKHHVQGRSSRGAGFGLIHDGNLVACMSFSTSLSSRGQTTDPSRWELVRYATSKPVAGGASRLFAAFLREHPECLEVVSFSDKRVFSGKVYPTIGFSCDAHLPPDYSYVKGGTGRRLSKRLFKLSELPLILGPGFDPSRTEHENALANGYYRVYDSGKIRWKWSR